MLASNMPKFESMGCLRCDEEIENDGYTFFKCDQAKKFWDLSWAIDFRSCLQLVRDHPGKSEMELFMFCL